MATFIIGGKKYVAPILNFKAVRVVWPLLETLQGNEKTSAALEALPAIVEAALARTDSPLTVAEIDDQLLSTEMSGLQEAVQQLFIESELLEKAPVPGEAPAASPSTETGAGSSQSLSPLVAPVATGIE